MGRNIRTVESVITGPTHIEINDLDIVRKLIDRGADLGVDAQGLSPLHSAVSHCHLEIVKIFLDTGIDINLMNRHGRSPLLSAFEDCAFPEMYRYLIEHGADLTIMIPKYYNRRWISTVGEGWTLLHLAAWDADYELARYLIDHGADVNAKRDAYGETPLHVISSSLEDDLDEAIKIATLLIDHEAILDQRDEDGTTPLMKASGNGFTELVELLIDNGANIAAEDEDCESATSRALTYVQPKILKLLVDNGVKRNMHVDVALCDIDAVMRRIDNGEDVNARTLARETPLHIASAFCMQKGIDKIVSILLDNGANPNAKNFHDETPLDMARLWSDSPSARKEITELVLLSAGGISGKEQK